MLRNINYKSNKENDKEIIAIAIERIKEEISLYSKKDNVVYFINEETIQKNKAEIEAIDLQLDEIEEKKKFAEFYEKELHKEGKGKSVEQLQIKLKELISTRETIVKIHSLPQLREELDNISQTISFDKSILHKLKKHYETMTNEDFTNQINLIY